MFRFTYILMPSLLMILLAPHLAAAATLAEDSQSATIIAYQRIGEDQWPDTNIRQEQFEAHLNELIAGNYNVISLSDFLDSIDKDNPLSDNTIVLTFDGGYKSAYKNAFPLLIENDIPFTVFFAPYQASANIDGYMNWSDLKKLSKSPLVTLGLHPARYTRLANEQAKAIQLEVNTALTNAREKLGQSLSYFAYPFGEYSEAYKNIVMNKGLRAAVSQHSSVAYNRSDKYALPRFTMTQNFGDIERFRLISAAQPMPVKDLSPAYPEINPNQQSFSFQMTHRLQESYKNLRCFISNQTDISVSFSGSIVTVEASEPLTVGRTRLNCTMNDVSEDGSQKWRWFGRLYKVTEHGTEIVQNEKPD